MSLGSGTRGGSGAAPTAPGAQELENAVRESDGGTLPKGWPGKYREVISAALAGLGPDEHVRAAWRIRTLGPAQRAGGVGLLVVTDRQVLGADHSSKRGGIFVVPVRAVAQIEVTTQRTGTTDLGGAVRLRGPDGVVLGGAEHPADFQVIEPGRDPSGWDAHARSEAELAEVERVLRQWLPWAQEYTAVPEPEPEPEIALPEAARETADEEPRPPAHCAICENERPVARVVTVYTAIQRSSTRKSGFKEYETRTALEAAEQHRFDICADCERKDTRTMGVLFSPVLVIGLVLLALWLLQGISGWWFLLLLVPAFFVGAFLYSFVDLERRLVNQAIESRRPAMTGELAGRPALHAGWIDSRGRPIETASAVVGYTESEYKRVRAQMKRS